VRVRKDIRRVEAKGKIWGDVRYYCWGEKEHLIVRRFPDSAHSSF
jgi:hypothetical protein